MKVKVNEQEEMDKLITRYHFEHSEHDFSACLWNEASVC